MKDYTDGVAVDMRQMRRTGGWMVKCPECQRKLYRATNVGAMQSLIGHMNRDHYIPPRGNA